VLIVLDTVRADHLAPYGYARATTPSLDRRVREEFTLYENARSTSSWTLPSHASLFTGLLPAQHGAAPPGRHAQGVREDAPMLAEVLREGGWRTAAVFSNSVYLRARKPGRASYAFGMERGFEHFDDRLDGSIGGYLPLAQLLGGDLRKGHLHYRDAERITDLALAWLDRRGEGPFFLALNYMDAHAPNMPPPPFDRAFGGPVARDLLAPGAELQVLQYDRELAYLDLHLERLLSGLEQRGLYDRTALIVTSDHGEALGDHGFLYHGWVLYDALVRVPLYVKPAGGRTEERSSADKSGADVFRIALALAGLPAPAPADSAAPAAELYVNPKGVGGMEARTGRDLERNLVCWKDGPFKTIVGSNGEVEVYDVAADPRELAPLALSEGQRELALERARAWWRAWPVELGRAAELGADELERMRELGYAGE
jgi:arylsulfatase